MEDRNMLAADCIVICCCCECMILQILILILLKLPHKLVRKTKEYVKKLRARKRRTTVMQIELTRYDEDSFGSLSNSFRFDIQDSCLVESLEFGCCMNEIESVLEDFSSRGEFAFGSFWGGEVSSARSLCSCLKEEELDYDNLGYPLMELLGDANLSSLISS
ncbi:hypothetical protein Salat_1316100 [Sesamum alatum]|uniref:Uncharacterized protein n=1 Tax=Sesamum alatum TaxID=300844 RepID=A0AAE1YH67_9LAMI|nr:hypothetical protein Salat_1316100 [Sesamum alatum]